MNIALHIERLILDGLPLSSHQGAAVQAAIETELTRLLEERGMGNVSGGAVPHLSVPAIQLTAGGQPAQWGRQIARSLHDGLATSSVEPRQHKAHATTSPSQPSHSFSANAARLGR